MYKLQSVHDKETSMSDGIYNIAVGFHWLRSDPPYLTFGWNNTGYKININKKYLRLVWGQYRSNKVSDTSPRPNGLIHIENNEVIDYWIFN